MKIALLYKANNLHLINRAKLFLSKGHEVYYFGFLPKESVFNEDVPGLHYVDIPVFPIFSDKLYKFNLLFRMMWVYRHARKLHFDVLYIQGAGYGFLSFLFTAKAKVMEHMGSDVIIEAKKSYLRRLIHRLGYVNMQAIVQDSKVAQNSGIKYGAPKHNNFVINVGIDSYIFNKNIKKGMAKSRFGIGEDTKIVFSPRSINKLYNIDIIINAIPLVVKEFSDVKFVFSAHSVDQGYFDLIMDNNLKKHIVITGSLDNKNELPFMYADSDVVVSIPSSDSSPLTVYESMACHVPVIVSDLEWYKDSFIPNKHLITIPLRDEISLSKEILGVLNGNTHLDLNDAQENVFKNFNYKNENNKLLTLMDRLISETINE